MSDEQDETTTIKPSAGEPENENQTDTPAEGDFDKAFDVDEITIENRNIQSLVDGFSNDFSKALAVFLGKKFEITFRTLKYIEIKDILSLEDLWVYANFNMVNHHHHGLILFEKSLLNACVDYLFGSEELSEAAPGLHYGECAIKVARKIADICLRALQKSVELITEFNATLLECNDKPKAVIRNRYMPEKCCKFTFELSGMSSLFTLSFVIPESQMENITFQPHTNASPQTDMKGAETLPLTSAKGNLKDELNDVAVDLVAVLPEVKLNLSKVMNLKKGDLIPIGDPQQVELRVGDRLAYKAVVGQSNALRIVKITERLA